MYPWTSERKTCHVNCFAKLNFSLQWTEFSISPPLNKQILFPAMSGIFTFSTLEHQRLHNGLILEYGSPVSQIFLGILTGSFLELVRWPRFSLLKYLKKSLEWSPIILWIFWAIGIGLQRLPYSNISPLWIGGKIVTTIVLQNKTCSLWWALIGFVNPWTSEIGRKISLQLFHKICFTEYSISELLKIRDCMKTCHVNCFTKHLVPSDEQYWDLGFRKFSLWFGLFVQIASQNSFHCIVFQSRHYNFSTQSFLMIPGHTFMEIWICGNLKISQFEENFWFIKHWLKFPTDCGQFFASTGGFENELWTPFITVASCHWQQHSILNTFKMNSEIVWN